MEKRRSLLDPDVRRKWLAEFATDDLNYVIARYCGLNNELISYKKFGFILAAEDVEEEHLERSLFGEPTK